MNDLVAATLRSSPDRSGKTRLASRARGDAASFTRATVVAPFRVKYAMGSTRSGLWPDCENASTSRPGLARFAW